ncbi:capsid protein [Stenotrophomonas lactitubi]
MDIILAGLQTGDATTAMIGAAALIALVGFTKWAAKKVAGFFG